MTTPTKLSRGHVNKLSPKQCLQGEQVTNSSVFSFYLLRGSGEERGKKRTSSCFEESYSKSEKKNKGENRFIMAKYFCYFFILWGLWVVVEIGEAIVDHSSYVVRRQSMEGTCGSFCPQWGFWELNSGLQVWQQSLLPTEPSHWTLVMALHVFLW